MSIRETEPIVGRRLVTLTLLLGGLTAFGPLSMDLYLPAFPLLAADLHATQAQVQLTLTADVIGRVAGQLVLGPAYLLQCSKLRAMPAPARPVGGVDYPRTYQEFKACSPTTRPAANTSARCAGRTDSAARHAAAEVAGAPARVCGCAPSAARRPRSRPARSFTARTRRCRRGSPRSGSSPRRRTGSPRKA